MPKEIQKTSLVLKSLIIDLKKLSTKEKVAIWKRVANDLNKPSRSRSEVSVEDIEAHIRTGEIALVPGKILSQGELNKKVTVAAFKFSDAAKEKINKSGKAITIQQLMKENPKGKKVRILG
jgi:large subunit ribosomal protein L18e